MEKITRAKKYREQITYEGVSSEEEKSLTRAFSCLAPGSTEREEGAEVRCASLLNNWERSADASTRSVCRQALAAFCFFDGGMADLKGTFYTK